MAHGSGQLTRLLVIRDRRADRMIGPSVYPLIASQTPQEGATGAFSFETTSDTPRRGDMRANRYDRMNGR